MRRVKVIAECYICRAPIILYKHEDGTDRIGYVCKCDEKTITYPVPYSYPVNPQPPYNPWVGGPYWGRLYHITCGDNSIAIDNDSSYTYNLT